MGAARFQAVLFDLDGTLLDTLADLANSMNAVLERSGYPTHPVDAYRHFVGDGMEVLVRRVLPEGARTEEIVATCLADMRAEYGRRWAETTRLYPGVAELLDGVAARGVPMVVLSNKPDEFTRLTVAQLLAPWHFAVVRGMGPDTPAKPDPTGALAVAASVGVAPEAVLYLGDTATDMQTAVAAGMFALGVSWGFRDRAELEANGARQVIDAPTAALELL